MFGQNDYTHVCEDLDSALRAFNGAIGIIGRADDQSAKEAYAAVPVEQWRVLLREIGACVCGSKQEAALRPLIEKCSIALNSLNEAWTSRSGCHVAGVPVKALDAQPKAMQVASRLSKMSLNASVGVQIVANAEMIRKIPTVAITSENAAGVKKILEDVIDEATGWLEWLAADVRNGRNLTFDSASRRLMDESAAMSKKLLTQADTVVDQICEMLNVYPDVVRKGKTCKALQFGSYSDGVGITGSLADGFLRIYNRLVPDSVGRIAQGVLKK